VVKLLLFVCVVAIIYVVLRAPARREEKKPLPGQPQPMVRCAFCGVHFPESEAIHGDERIFCCEAHRQQGAKK